MTTRPSRLATRRIVVLLVLPFGILAAVAREVRDGCRNIRLAVLVEIESARSWWRK
jgi:hypothetical protein